MKARITRLVLPLLLWAAGASAQDLRGIWHGFITANDGTGELPASGYSLNIKSQKGEVLSGSAYIYGKYDLKFEGILDFIGTSDAQSREISITELRVLKYLEPSERHMLCIKLEDLRLIRQMDEDFLVGNWEGVATGGVRCIPGKVVLKRYDPVQPAGFGISDTLIRFISQDTTTRTQFLKTTLSEPIVIPVASRRIRLELRDYMQEDQDTVSVFYNRKEIIRNLRVTKRPRKFEISLPPRTQLNEIILYARNLGRIPPNTSNLTVDDGSRKHRILIRSTLQQSAVIYLRYTEAVPEHPAR
ncbi:MAG TPA: hypothetical protein VGD92_04940 [Sphingobacteriaceae bacterium]